MLINKIPELRTQNVIVLEITSMSCLFFFFTDNSAKSPQQASYDLTVSI